MIIARSPFSRLANGSNRDSRILFKRIAMTPEETRFRDSLFDRAGTVEDYFAAPRVPSLLEQLESSRRIIECLERELAVAQYTRKEESRLASLLVIVIGRIVEISEHLFPGPVSFQYTYDPENPSDEYLVFDVVARGSYADYRDREFEWHEEVRKIVPGAFSEFRLCVMPQR